MLHDTSDIVRQVAHPAAWPRDGDGDGDRGGPCPALRRLPAERLLARPCVSDDAGLAPELLALWGWNMCKITGKAGTQLPFRMRGARGEEQRGAVAEKIMETEAGDEAAEEEEGKEEGVEDVEKARSQEARDSTDGHDVHMSDVEFGEGEQDINFDQEEEQQNEDMDTPFDIQEDINAAENKTGDLAEEEEDESSVHSDRSSFSLGAVNDLEKELYDVGNDDAEDGDDPRQTLGDELVSHTSKWHKHTIRVLGMLKRNICSRLAGELDKEEMDK